MWGFTAEEVRDLVQGKFQFRNCLDCNSKGWVWVCPTIGEIVDAPTDEYCYKEQCEDCKGLGGHLRLDCWVD